jgi:polysaccharide biosynthesis transport protein
MNEKQGVFSSLSLSLQRRSLPATATFTSVILGALLYLIFAPRQYQGMVRLILDDQQASVSQIGQELTKVSNYIPGEYSPLADRAELLKSKQILDSAISMVYGNNSDPKEIPSLTELRREIKIKIIPATNILEVEYEHQDPEIAAKFVNSLAEATIEKNKQDIRVEAKSLREFLEYEVARQQEKATQAEASENRYRERNRLVSLNSQTDNLVNSIGNLESQEATLQAQIRENQARVSQLQKLVSIDSAESAYVGGRVGQDRELQQLRSQLENLESQLASSRSRFTNNNPQLIAIQEERDEVARLYEQKLSRVAGDGGAVVPGIVADDQLSQDSIAQLVTAKTELSSLQAKLDSIQQDRIELQRRLEVLPGMVQPLTELMRTTETTKTSLQFLQRKLEEARIAEAQLFSDIKIVDESQVAEKPSSPNVPVVIALASLAASILSFGLVVILESLDNTVGDIEELEQKLQLPMLGAPPALPPEAVSLEYSDHFVYDVKLVEPYRAFLRNLESRAKEKLTILTIASTIPGEGKSVVASHLAVVSAILSRRTLLIDADLRRPQQHNFFNLEMQPGLSDVIDGYINLSDAIQPTKTKNLSVLTCGRLPNLPSIVLDSPKIKDILASLAEQYDFIIIDTPPVTSCADAHTLAQQSDGMVMVTRPNVTPKDVLARAISELKRNGVPVFGFVTNGNTVGMDKYYNYGYESYQSMQTPALLAPAENHGKGVN